MSGNKKSDNTFGVPDINRVKDLECYTRLIMLLMEFAVKEEPWMDKAGLSVFNRYYCALHNKTFYERLPNGSTIETIKEKISEYGLPFEFEKDDLNRYQIIEKL